MQKLFRPINELNASDALYFYDGGGRRIKKTTGNRIVIFVYNSSGSVVAEYDSQPATNPQVSYLTADHLSLPKVITDGCGAVISKHDYMSFGEDTETIGNGSGRPIAQEYSILDEIRRSFTGYERDDETRLVFVQARYYNSNHGRFTSVDPFIVSVLVRDPQTFNQYSYVLNNPYKFTYPLGLFAPRACYRVSGEAMLDGASSTVINVLWEQSQTCRASLGANITKDIHGKYQTIVNLTDTQTRKPFPVLSGRGATDGVKEVEEFQRDYNFSFSSSK